MKNLSLIVERNFVHSKIYRIVVYTRKLKSQGATARHLQLLIMSSAGTRKPGLARQRQETD